MAFFKKKKEEMDIGLPPPPPVELPPIKLEEKIKPIFEEPAEKREAPKFNLPKLPSFEKSHISDNVNELNLPDLGELEKELPPVPDLEELESELPPIRKSEKKELPEPDFFHTEPEHEEITAGPIETHEVMEKPRSREGPVFVNVGNYKESLSNVNIIRSKIKESIDTLEKLNEIKNSKDNYFEQFRSKLEDLQRKSLYVDKNLFAKLEEGELK